MLCPSCGAPVGETVKLCPRCETGKPRLEMFADGEEGGSFGRAQNRMLVAPDDVRFAGFFLRFFALLIDLAILSPMFVVANYLFTTVFHLSIPPPPSLWPLGGGVSLGAYVEQLGLPLVKLVLAYTGLWLSLVWIFYAAFEASFVAGTPGKLFFGLAVTNFRFERVSFARASSRHFNKVLFSMLITGMLGFLFPLVTKRKQALHDLMTRSFVVRRNLLSFFQLFVRAFMAVAFFWAVVTLMADRSVQERIGADRLTEKLSGVRETLVQLIPRRFEHTVELPSKIPNQLLSGTLGRRSFRLETAELRDGVLALRQGRTGAGATSIIIFLGKGAEQNREGKTIIVDENSVGQVPTIHLSSHEPGEKVPKTVMFTSNERYRLKLEWGKREGDKISGRLAILFLDDLRSQVAGEFEAIVR